MKSIIIILVLLLPFRYIYSQSNIVENRSIMLQNEGGKITSGGPFTTASIGVGAFLYLINPILLYEDKKIYAGITKELSVGFGKFGEHRAAFEYSFVFTGNISHHIRFSYKYDLLLKSKIEPSHVLQGTAVVSLGAGYFTNFTKHGAFPELTFGYSLRNHKLLIYPHVKIRHTFMFNKGDGGITDLSFGIILGIANPFIDVKIKREY
jgi:hypothetical protein